MKDELLVLAKEAGFSVDSDGDVSIMADYESALLTEELERFTTLVAAKEREEIERLRRVCRDAYEVWAGSEGIPLPATAAEAYVLQLLTQMRDEVKKGLK